MNVYLALYLIAVIQDGDYLNDFLVDLPFWARPAAELLGWGLALALGF